jgi:Family of unknown function (DUF6481)
VALFKAPDLADRRAAAEAARRRALEKFKSQPKPGDPVFEARQAELLARDERRLMAELQRQQAKADAAAAEEAARQAEIARQKAAEEAAHAAKLAKQAELEAQQQAARDARYAARKAAKLAKKGR